MRRREFEPTFIDRDQLIETEIVSASNRTAFGVFWMLQGLARINEVQGLTLSRRAKDPHIVDVLVRNPEEVVISKEDTTGLSPTIIREIIKFQKAVEDDGQEVTPQVGEFLNIGLVDNPATPMALRKAKATYNEFAEQNGRGKLETLFYYVETVPFVPIKEFPEDKVARVERAHMSVLQIDSGNLSFLYPFFGSLRLLASIPEVNGVVVSRGTEVTFLDVFVDQTADINLTGRRSREVIQVLTGYARNTGIGSPPRFGGLVVTEDPANLEAARKKYLEYAQWNRRRDIISAFYFA